MRVVVRGNDDDDECHNEPEPPALFVVQLAPGSPQLCDVAAFLDALAAPDYSKPPSPRGTGNEPGHEIVIELSNRTTTFGLDLCVVEGGEGGAGGAEGAGATALATVFPMRTGVDDPEVG